MKKPEVNFIMGRIRFLGNAEYFYFLYNRIATTNFVVLIESSERLETANLQTAIEAVIDKYEVFRMHIVVESPTRLSFVTGDSRIPRIIHLQPSTIELNTVIEIEINTPLETEDTPFRFTIYSDEEASSHHLIITFNHTLIDASAAVSIAQEILLAAKFPHKFESSAQTLLPNLEKLLPRKTRGIFVLKAILLMVMRGLKSTKLYGKPEKSTKGRYNYKSRNIHLQRMQLNSEKTTAIIELARKNSITVHHLLSAVQLVAFRKFYKEEGVLPLMIAMPVNLRNFLTPPLPLNAPGLFISIPKLTIPIPKEYFTIEIARMVKSNLDDQIASGEAVVLWKILPRSIFKASPQGIRNVDIAFSKNPDYSMLSNLGVVPTIEPFRNIDFVGNIQFGVAPPKDCMLCVSVCSHNGSMNINLCFNTDLLTYDNCTQYIAEYNKVLNTLLEWKAEGSQITTARGGSLFL
jgi:NRPS condensation-like uncharacterized protein